MCGIRYGHCRGAPLPPLPGRPPTASLLNSPACHRIGRFSFAGTDARQSPREPGARAWHAGSNWNKGKWCRLGDLNTRPSHYECDALPAELRRRRSPRARFPGRKLYQARAYVKIKHTTASPTAACVPYALSEPGCFGADRRATPSSPDSIGTTGAAWGGVRQE